MRLTLLPLTALLLLGAAPPPEPVTMHLVLTDLRSADGVVRLCVWRDAAAFPDCAKGHGVVTATADAAATVRIDVPGLAPGAYAVSAIHDENGNDRLDKSFIGIPTEGVGFSGGARVRFGPPSFAKAVVDARAETTQHIRLQYFL